MQATATLCIVFGFLSVIAGVFNWRVDDYVPTFLADLVPAGTLRRRVTVIVTGFVLVAVGALIGYLRYGWFR